MMMNISLDIANINAFNLFNVYGLSLRALAIAYAYMIGPSPRPLYIFSLDKDNM